MRTFRLIIDADSILFASAVTSDNLEEAYNKSVDKIVGIYSFIEEKCRLERIYLCHGNRGNWRKFLCHKYKMNRTAPVPEFLDDLHNEIERAFNHGSTTVHRASGEETDDLVVDLWKELTSEGHKVIISAIDKDFHQIPANFHNFRTNEFYKLDEVEALRSFYTQMIAGDQADNIKTCPKKGKAFAKKLFTNCTSKYSFVRATFEVYKELYKGKAKNKYIHTYHLLKLGKRDDNFYLKLYL